MTWNTFHHRGEILHTVVDAANARRDGVLPMDSRASPRTSATSSTCSARCC